MNSIYILITLLENLKIMSLYSKFTLNILKKAQVIMRIRIIFGPISVNI